MQIKEIIYALEQVAPPALQEEYDNAGLITGNIHWECTGVMVSLDATEAVIQEAIEKGCNMVVSHHPIVFKGLKKLSGRSYVERAIISAIKHDIALYAIHTNLDNVLPGVNGKMADLLGLINRKILAPKKGLLQKLSVFVPMAHKDALMNALFAAGAGNIGGYSECSFATEGMGSFKAGENAQPFVGQVGHRHTEPELRLEVIFPQWMQASVVKAMIAHHPYEEVAYDIYPLANSFLQTGSGLIGELMEPIRENEMLQLLKNSFKTGVIKHTPLTGKPIKKIALCGGAGSFLTGAAIAAGADIFITADLKYHEFFDADQKLVLADIGHFESEQFTIDLLFDILRENFPTFAVLKTGVNTNPVCYFT